VSDCDRQGIRIRSDASIEPNAMELQAIERLEREATSGASGRNDARAHSGGHGSIILTPPSNREGSMSLIGITQTLSSAADGYTE